MKKYFSNKIIISNLFKSGLLIPFNLMIYCIFPLFNFSKPFPKEFIAKFESEFLKTFKCDSRKSDTENFWLTSIYVTNHSSIMHNTVQKFLSLYGFNRNMSMACLLLIFTFLIMSLFGFNNNLYVNLSYFLCFFGYYIFFIRYYYIYINYYTKFIIRSFLVLKCCEEEEK